MNPVLIMLLVFLIFIFATSIIATRILVSSRRKDTVLKRLESLIAVAEPSAVTSLNFKAKKRVTVGNKAPTEKLYKHLERLHGSASLKTPLNEIISSTLLAAVFPPLLVFLLDFPFVLGIAAGALVLAGPYVYARVIAGQRRNKFLLQLPSAIDLMVSVLRSGHSVPQAVRSVSEEMPSPCCQEFSEVFQRMNLGQSLSEALQHSVDRYESFELDLIRKATSIQQEIGGSLSDLLEKTNETLRQRIKLKNQIKVLTTQGRLSAWICGLLPLAIAIGFSQINPDYLKPLFESPLGQTLLVTAIVLEFSGLIIMRKLSSFRI